MLSVRSYHEPFGKQTKQYQWAFVYVQCKIHLYFLPYSKYILLVQLFPG